MSIIPFCRCVYYHEIYTANFFFFFKENVQTEKYSIVELKLKWSILIHNALHGNAFYYIFHFFCDHLYNKIDQITFKMYTLVICGTKENA